MNRKARILAMVSAISVTAGVLSVTIGSAFASHGAAYSRML